MSLYLYNTRRNAKEEFKPLSSEHVGMYSCGPTVYHYAHIGNLRSFLFADLLKRSLRYNGYAVRHVMNITDVGHLTSDADLGEDKMLLAALKENKSVWDVARYYTDVFLCDSAALNIIPPDVVCKATDHIQQQIDLIKKLEKGGYTYGTSDGIYFDTAKFPRYAEFARLPLEEQRAGVRVAENEEKRQPWDFALWKFSIPKKIHDIDKFPKRQMEWESPWGVGFPGWHIECSAMSTYYLGQPFDIHTGGIDLIKTHHTNESAQSEAAAGKPMAQFWMHSEHLIVDSQRMGKSEGNFLLLSALQEKGYSPLAYRFFCLNAHYRQILNFSWEALDAAARGLRHLQDTVRMVCEHAMGETHDNQVSQLVKDVAQTAREDFLSAINDDLSSSKALAVVFDTTKKINKESSDCSPADWTHLHALLLEFDMVLGLQLDAVQGFKIPNDILALASDREEARRNRRWNDADELRARIEQRGYRVEDTSRGVKVVPL